MSFNLSKILIVLLLFLIVLLALKLFKKQKIKQTRYKSDSGYIVKSRAELIIANWLFYRGIDFIYEKKTPTKERVISDFYLTQSDVYIEFWGLETPQYLKRKSKKIKIYKKNRLKLIQMDDGSLHDLNTFFAKEFKKFKSN
ncbi:helicase IV [uncultured Campylobacter sp.]|uniref:helicase IV n=1 Tax=uncultured Campylobacter sp. TaxID=218934 RepID=UPI0026050089|nr:helicase IV [uncultured Campylobacter sp.]